MPTAQKLPSGKWRVRTYDHGKRRSYTADTRKEAERLAAIGAAEEKEKANRGMTLKDALAAFIETCRAQGYSPSTIAGYTSQAASAFGMIADKPLDRLTMQDVQAQLDARINAGKSIKTTRNDFFLLRAVLGTFAPKLDLRRIRIAKRSSRPKMVFREAMPAQIMEAVKNAPADFRLYIAFALFTGLRPSESYALCWRDISAEPIIVAADPPCKVGTISVSSAMVRDEKGVYRRKPPKTESGNRTQLIAWALFELIYSLKSRGADDDPVLTMKPNSATKRWDAMRQVLPVPETMRLYDLRHLYATAVANSGASEEELASRMGHSTSTFSHAVYVELFEDRQRNTNLMLAKATDAALTTIQSTEQESAM